MLALRVQRTRGREDRHVLLTDRRMVVDEDGRRTAVLLRDIRGWTEPPADADPTRYRFDRGEGHPSLRFEVVGAENRAKLDAVLWPAVRGRPRSLEGDAPGLD